MSKHLEFEEIFSNVMQETSAVAIVYKSKYVTYEHILLALCANTQFADGYKKIGGDVDALAKNLKAYIKKYVPTTQNPDDMVLSVYTDGVIQDTALYAAKNNEKISLGVFLCMAVAIEQSFGNFYLSENMKEEVTEDEYLRNICEAMKTKYVDLEEITRFMMQAYPDIANQINGSLQEGQEKSSAKSQGGWKKLVTNVNELVKEMDMPVIGREKEIAETIEILLRKTKSNPVHIGEAGVGKTSITYGLAALINSGDVPEKLKNKTIYQCNFSSITGGASYVGILEQRLKSVFEGIAKEGAILFMDEIQTLFTGNYTAAGDTIKPFLTRDDVSVIGSATSADYRKYIEKDSALERRFSPVVVEEPSEENTLKILNGVISRYEDFHKCIYPSQLLQNIVSLSNKYMRDRRLPDKAIDIIDEAGAKMNAGKRPMDERVVDMDIVCDILSKRCHIPKDTIMKSADKSIKTLSDNMKKIVIGQDSAIDKISDSLMVSKAGLRGENKPIANLLFVGPTGVGKTFIAETLSKELNIPIIRKDMSEFSESHSVSKLFGSPAGYVGYDEGGMLVNEIRKNPNCILLLDEIEKAHPIIFDTLLQIMDNATLTDGLGKKADFRNVILIMTSNAGAADAEKRAVGFNNVAGNTDKIMKEVNISFKPEFRNRLDAIIQFNPLSEEMAATIAKNQMNELCGLLKRNNVTVSVDEPVLDYVINKGYSKEFGARNIKRVIETDIKVPLSKKLLFEDLKNGGNIKMLVDDNVIKIEEATV